MAASQSGSERPIGVLLFNLGGPDTLDLSISFVSDHIETLYEVDMLFADEAARHGIVEYRRPAALNTHPTFIEALAQLVERHLESEP